MRNVEFELIVPEERKELFNKEQFTVVDDNGKIVVQFDFASYGYINKSVAYWLYHRNLEPILAERRIVTDDEARNEGVPVSSESENNHLIYSFADDRSYIVCEKGRHGFDTELFYLECHIESTADKVMITLSVLNNVKLSEVIQALQHHHAENGISLNVVLMDKVSWMLDRIDKPKAFVDRLRTTPFLDMDEKHVKIKVRFTEEGYSANCMLLQSYSGRRSDRSYHDCRIGDYLYNKDRREDGDIEIVKSCLLRMMCLGRSTR